MRTWKQTRSRFFANFFFPSPLLLRLNCCISLWNRSKSLEVFANTLLVKKVSSKVIFAFNLKTVNNQTWFNFKIIKMNRHFRKLGPAEAQERVTRLKHSPTRFDFNIWDKIFTAFLLHLNCINFVGRLMNQFPSHVLTSFLENL